MSHLPQSVPRRRPGAESSRFGADYVVLDPAGNVLRGLNETAARVWELIDGKRTAQEISRCIEEEHRARSPQILADVLAFLDLLQSKDLLEAAEGGTRR